MMIKYKLFLSFIDEKRWLKKQNSDGFELMSASLFRYNLEKTNVDTCYEYVPLRRGKKTFIELKKSKHDSKLLPVYANAELALFKKARNDGEITLLPYDKRRMEFLKYRSSVNTNALVTLGIGAIFILLAGRLTLPILYFPAALTMALSLSMFYQSSKIEKYIKTLK